VSNILRNQLIIKDAVVSINGDTYQDAISSVVFTPSADKITWKGISSSFTDTSASTWEASITFTQDFDTPGSLSLLLFNGEGTTVPMVFKPRSGVGSSITANIVLSPGAMGGVGGATAEATVTLGCATKPVIVPGTPVIPTVTATSPVTGPVAGGTLVKVTGSKFTGTTTVKFGTVNASAFTVDSDSTIYAVAPAQAAGAKNITVTNAVGVSTTTGSYTYA
jgi:hypothetical protein